MANKPKKTLRETVHLLMEPYVAGPDASRAGLFIDLFVLVCILGSCSLIVVEHVWGDSGTPGIAEMLWAAEIVFTAIFTVEYLVRWYGSPNRVTYPLSFYAAIDILAILPSYIMLAHVLDLSPDFLALRLVRVMRLLRVLRLLRLLKFIRHGNMIFRLMVDLKIWFSTARYHYNLDRLLRLMAWTALAWVIGTNVVWITESTLATSAGPYNDYWSSYSQVIIVLISGMDAEMPVTMLGMVEVTALLLVGICVVGMLTGEIVSILVRSAQRRGKLPLKPPGLSLEQHFLILGRNRHLENVIRQVIAALEGPHHVLIVSPDAEEIENIPSAIPRRVMALPGDPSREEVLVEAGVSDALRVIVLSNDCEDEPCRDRDNRALMYALAVAARNREMPLVVELQEDESLRYAGALPSAECIVRHKYGEKLIGQAVLNPGVTAVYDELMTFTDDSNELYTIPIPPSLTGKTFREVQRWFMENDTEPILPLGIDWSKGDQRYERFMLHPSDAEVSLSGQGRVLGPGDRLIVMAYEQPSFAQTTEEDLWSGKSLARS